MSIKTFLLVSSGIIVCLLSTLLIYQTAFASGEEWYWDGTDTLVARGGVFGNGGAQFTTTNNDDTTNPEYKGENFTVTVPGKNYGKVCDHDGNTETNCEWKDYDAPCKIDSITIHVDKNSDTVSVGSISYHISNNSDGSMECRDHDPLQVDGGKIKNKQGESAVDGSLNQRLDEEKQRLRDSYAKDSCGPQPTPDCLNNAKRAFDGMWDTCMGRASHIVVTTPQTAQTKLDTVAACVKQYTGQDIDKAKLTERIANIPDYQNEPSSCSLEFIGYVICPLSRFMAKITDKAFDALKSFMEIAPINRGTKGGDSLFSVWAVMRNIANVLFVIAFMVIIYAQLTGIGLDNYGIKKLLPRIIIAAVLVNSSFYICAIAIDVSNVFGNSIQAVLSGIANSLHAPDVNINWSNMVEKILLPGAATLSVAAITVTTAALYLSFSAMIPLLTATLLALLTAIIMLTARYALIIILVIVTPIAFVAWLLPNTQKWFSMWLKTFIALLMLYPIMGLIYGGSTLAGIIFMNSTGGRGSFDAPIQQMFGLAIQSVPLFITPLVMKLSGGVLNRFGGRVSNNGLFRKANKGAEGFAARRKDARDLKGLQHIGDKKRSGLAGARDKAVQRRFKRESIRTARGGQLNRAKIDYASSYTSGAEGSGGDKTSLLERAREAASRDENGEATYTAQTNGQRFAEKMAKGGGDGALDRVKANAISTQINLHKEEVVKAKTMITNSTADDAMKRAIASGERNELNGKPITDAMQQAAIELVAEEQGNGIDDVVKASGKMSGQTRSVLAKAIQNNHGPSYYKSPTAINNILQGKVSGNDSFLQNVVAPSVNEGRMNASMLAGSESEDIDHIHAAIAAGHITADAAQQVTGQAQHALDNQYTKEQATKETANSLGRLARGDPPRRQD